MAVMEIMIPDVKTQQDQTKNRAILMANAIVTVFSGDGRRRTSSSAT